MILEADGSHLVGGSAGGLVFVVAGVLTEAA